MAYRTEWPGLFPAGLGALVRKNKSSPGDEPWGAKGCEAACACRSPVTQKSRSQARLFLPAKPFCENLAPLLPKTILVKVTKKSSFGLHAHNAFLSEIAPSETVVYLDETFRHEGDHNEHRSLFSCWGNGVRLVAGRTLSFVSR